MATALKSAAKPASKPRAPKASTPAPIADGIVPTTLTTVPFGRLKRAPENVRHTRIDEDVQSLADDIAAHGLLQSLIGYAGTTSIDAAAVYIVGGGRRLQALGELADRGLIQDAYPVPVLIRPLEEAVELSLSENLAQRTMSPVDEFFAFKSLMDRGGTSPADLAKRFGFSERVVKQRLRLADLVPEILDALSERKITLDSAMAYAGTQDRGLQAKVFKAQSKSPYDAHRPDKIKWAYRDKTLRTDSPLFVYVGAEAYERGGGGYEDDLFTAVNDDDQVRTLTDAPKLVALANDHIDFQLIGRQIAWADELECETIVGCVKIDGLMFPQWGINPAKGLDGFAWVAQPYSPDAGKRMWKTVRNNSIDVQLLVGIDQDGKLSAYDKGFFVPKAQVKAVYPQEPSTNYGSRSQSDIDAENRKRSIREFAARKALPSVDGTPFDGVLYWSERMWLEPVRAFDVERGAAPGFWAEMKMFVTEEMIQAHLADGEAALDVHTARVAEARAAREDAKAAAAAVLERRDEELRAMEPPAIVVIDGDVWSRAEDGSYSIEGEEEDAFLDGWIELLDHFDIGLIDDVYATATEFAARIDAQADSEAGA